ncbi:hypothetical protein Mycch_5379 (plasmid) [Mycolicibacterium chubuense NBB4]|uniref:Uncharacterized protein n=1 Tax=Mycolicibacterium chubuense (strain NBB4) TaxID=710421 RepID=I4BRZ9_MYCCN|nr:hypothetical protein Mycch_5379 [Mycolicibacterium chubuense NBB4]
MGTGLLVGEIEYLELDRHTTNAAPNLEGIDAFIDKVAEELRPRTLLPVGGVPDPRFAGSVVTTGPSCGVETRYERMSRWALVPEFPGQRASPCGCNRVGERHT